MGTKGFNLTDATPVAAREDSGQLVTVRDLDGSPMTYTAGEVERPVTMLVAGTYSDVYRKTELEQQRRRVGKRQTKATPEDILANVIELEAACILAWDGFFDNGAPLALTKEHAIAVLSAAKWIREQVEEAMNDHAGFFASNATR